MNYLETLQASPVWERFIDYYVTENNLHFKVNKFVPYYDLPNSYQLAALVDWLDTEGVYLNTDRLINPNLWMYNLNNNGEMYTSRGYDYTSRSEALRAGIKKGFEVLEKKP